MEIHQPFLSDLRLISGVVDSDFLQQPFEYIHPPDAPTGQRIRLMINWLVIQSMVVETDRSGVGISR